MTERASEYVVIGGGVYGVATAWELARQGREVTLLEARQVAAGASGGLGHRGVRANGRDPRELPLMHRAYAMWPTLAGELGGETAYERTGHLLLYERDHDLASAEARAWMQERLGVPTRVLDGAQARQIEPGLAESVIGALHCPLDGVADHTATTRAYARAAEAAGAVVREGAPAAGLLLEGDRVAAVRLEDGSDLAVGKGVLIVANTGTPELLERSLGVRLPVWRVFPQALLTSPVQDAPFTSLIGHAHRRLALKMVPGGSVMASGGWRGRWNAELCRGEPVSERVADNWSEATMVFPELAGLEVVQATADRAETSSIDGIPLIDRVPGATNGVFACGWCGHGWAIAPAVAPLLAEWVAEGHRSKLLMPFSLERFSPAGAEPSTRRH